MTPSVARAGDPDAQGRCLRSHSQPPPRNGCSAFTFNNTEKSDGSSKACDVHLWRNGHRLLTCWIASRLPVLDEGCADNPPRQPSTRFGWACCPDKRSSIAWPFPRQSPRAARRSARQRAVTGSESWFNSGHMVQFWALEKFTMFDQTLTHVGQTATPCVELLAACPKLDKLRTNCARG